MTTTVTATAEPADLPPRVRLQVTTDQTQLVLYRVDQDGTRTPVRSYDGAAFATPGGTLTAFDPEPPYGLAVTYSTSDPATTSSAPVTVSVDDVWMVHPGVPVRSQPVLVAGLSAREYEANGSVRYPLARRFPIVATDGRRKAAIYTMTVRTRTLDTMGSLEVLLDDLSPLLLNVPAGRQWGQISEYVHVGRVTAGRIVRWGSHPMREWQLPCTVVGRPAGGSQADVTYGRTLAQYATYGARLAAYPTYGDVINS